MLSVLFDSRRAAICFFRCYVECVFTRAEKSDVFHPEGKVYGASVRPGVRDVMPRSSICRVKRLVLAKSVGFDPVMQSVAALGDHHYQIDHCLLPLRYVYCRSLKET